MRLVIWLLLLAAAAVVAALTFGRNDGLVSLYWGGWRADLSLNLFLIGMLVLGAAALLVAQALLAVLRLPRRAAEWRALQRERAAQAALRESLGESFGARYARAHKAALRALTLHHDTGGADREFAQLAHLMAAGSLHRLGDRARRDEHLTSLAELRRGGGATRADDGARLAAVEWALDDRDPDRAAALLAELPPGVARRTHALRLRLRAAQLAARPLQALQTARLLAKHQAFSPEVARGLLRTLACDALDTAHDAQQLRQAWQQLDAGDRRDPHVAVRAASRAVALGLLADARAWLRPHWETLTGFDDADARERLAQALVAAAPGLEGDWLPLLEAALQRQGQHPEVQLAVGVAFAERQLWGKARQLLQRAAGDDRLAPPLRRIAWMRLAALAREQGDAQTAASCDREAAALCG
ncbi:MAG: heme biosynthesis protein HemY [Burkholderiales bacterium]|nr:heme biosynthesis protein HemY [Burkholderiales bacterium]